MGRYHPDHEDCTNPDALSAWFERTDRIKQLYTASELDLHSFDSYETDDGGLVIRNSNQPYEYIRLKDREQAVEELG